jgi:hypothetical protein
MEYIGPIVIYSIIFAFFNGLFWALGMLIMAGIGIGLTKLFRNESIAGVWMAITYILSIVYAIWCIHGWWYGITHMSHVHPVS